MRGSHLAGEILSRSAQLGVTTRKSVYPAIKRENSLHSTHAIEALFLLPAPAAWLNKRLDREAHMSRVLHLAGKIRAVAPYLATEDQAIEVAKGLSARIAEGSSLRDRERLLPHDEPGTGRPVGAAGDHGARRIWRCRHFQRFPGGGDRHPVGGRRIGRADPAEPFFHPRSPAPFR